MHEEQEPRPRFKIVGAGGPDDTQPCQTVGDNGPRLFLRRRQERRLDEARAAGRQDETDALAERAACALVPAPFLDVCRVGKTPREVSIMGITVMVVPARQDTDPNPAAELDAWETFREIVIRTTIPPDGSKIPQLPPQVSAAYWRHPNGRELKVTADHGSPGWLRRHLGRPGGVASVVPLVGVGGVKAALSAVALGVGVVVVVAGPGESIPHAAEAHHPHEVSQVFVPALGAQATTQPRKQMAKTNERKSLPSPQPSGGPGKAGTPTAAPSPAPNTHEPAAPHVPSPSPEPVPPTEQAIPSHEPTPEPEVTVQDQPTLDADSDPGLTAD